MSVFVFIFEGEGARQIMCLPGSDLEGNAMERRVLGLLAEDPEKAEFSLPGTGWDFHLMYLIKDGLIEPVFRNTGVILVGRAQENPSLASFFATASAQSPPPEAKPVLDMIERLAAWSAVRGTIGSMSTQMSLAGIIRRQPTTMGQISALLAERVPGPTLWRQSTGRRCWTSNRPSTRPYDALHAAVL